MLRGEKPLESLYPWLKALHVGAVMVSGTLFAARGLARELRLGIAMAAPVRYASYTIDSVLLIAAIGLVVVLAGHHIRLDWVVAKVILLPVYVVLGSFALKRARTDSLRRISFALALLTFAAIYSIARTHEVFGGI
jgi:uncharacterized membrane protein SirB2